MNSLSKTEFTGLSSQDFINALIFNGSKDLLAQVPLGFKFSQMSAQCGSS